METAVNERDCKETLITVRSVFTVQTLWINMKEYRLCPLVSKTYTIKKS